MRTLAKAAVLLAAIAFVFAPAIHGRWLWDDDREITHNPEMRDVRGLADAWLSPKGTDYFPLKDTVLWAEWRLFGEDTLGYHLTSILLHALSALLLWRLLLKLLPQSEPAAMAAWFGGLLFAVHPLAVESVAWISELKNTLSLPLLLLSLYAYIEWDERRGQAATVAGVADPGYRPQRGRLQRSPTPFLSLLAFILAMLAKTSVTLFPVVILLYAWWRRGRISKRDLLASVSFFAVSTILGVVTIRFQHGQYLLSGGAGAGGPAARIARAGIAIVFYLSKVTLPARLDPIYRAWSFNPVDAAQFLPWAALFAIFLYLRRTRRPWSRGTLFGVGVAIANLLLVLGIVRMSFMRFTWVSDHFAYLSLAALAGFAGAGLAALLERASAAYRPIALGGAGLLALGLAAGARGHAALFRDPETLWTAVLRNQPGSWLAENNLASALADEGRPMEALPHFEAALRLNPDAPEVENDLGSALVQAGRPEQAGEYFRKAVQLLPDFAQARFNYGNFLMDEGRYGEAIDQFEEAARLEPGAIEILGNLGLALVHAGRGEDAVTRYRQALAIDPSVERIRDNLGNALLLLGRYDDARREFAESLRGDPGDADAEFGLGNALAVTGHPGEAIPHFEAAIRLRRGFEAAEENLDAARRALGSVR